MPLLVFQALLPLILSLLPQSRILLLDALALLFLAGVSGLTFGPVSRFSCLALSTLLCFLGLTPGLASLILFSLSSSLLTLSRLFLLLLLSEKLQFLVPCPVFGFLLFPDSLQLLRCGSVARLLLLSLPCLSGHDLVHLGLGPLHHRLSLQQGCIQGFLFLIVALRFLLRRILFFRTLLLYDVALGRSEDLKFLVLLELTLLRHRLR